MCVSSFVCLFKMIRSRIFVLVLQFRSSRAFCRFLVLSFARLLVLVPGVRAVCFYVLLSWNRVGAFTCSRYSTRFVLCLVFGREQTRNTDAWHMCSYVSIIVASIRCHVVVSRRVRTRVRNTYGTKSQSPDVTTARRRGHR